MIGEHHEELASLYALDLLEGAEKTSFEAALAGDAELRALVESLRAAAADLARLAPPAEPPPELKARILSSLESRPTLRLAPETPDAHRATILPFSRVLLPWAIAASLAVATLWSARTAWIFHSENGVIRDQQQLAELDLRSLRNGMEAERLIQQQQLSKAQQALADASRQATDSREQLAQLRQDVDAAQQKFAEATRQSAEAGRQIAQLNQKLKKEGDLAQFKIATLASMLGNSPQALAVVVWNPMEQEGMIKLAKLDMPAAGMDYQLWLIGPDGKPISGGVVAMNPATGEAHVMFTSAAPINSVAKFAISLEQKGGMPEPHGKIVMTIE